MVKKLAVTRTQTVSLPPGSVLEVDEATATKLLEASPASYEVLEALAKARVGAKAAPKPAEDKQVKRPRKAKGK